MAKSTAVLAILFIGYDQKTVIERITEINNTIVPKVEKELGVQVIFQPVDEIHSNEFFYDISGARVTYKIMPGAKPPKGVTISNIIRGLHKIPSQPDYFVYCDGSGRIPFEHIIDVLRNLVEERCECVITRREPKRGGISETRKKIEEFESWLVSDQLKLSSTYDLQCGIWGYAVKKCSGMQLAATGYEIELNFALEAIKCKKSIGEMPVTINQAGTSKTAFIEAYDEKSPHLQKAYFLSGYFKIKKADFIERAIKYNTTHEEAAQVPKEYLAMLEKLEEVLSPPQIIQL